MLLHLHPSPRSLRQAWRLAGLLALAPWPLATLAALPCTLAAVGPASVASPQGAPLVLPAQLAQCDGVRVAQGRVVACVQDERERLVCRDLAAGQVLSAADWPRSGGDSAWLARVMALLRGSIERGDAVSRGGTAQAALPTGPVALLDGPLLLDFSSPALRDVDRVDFTTSPGGERVASVSGPGVQRLDAQALFLPGRSYAWTLRSSQPGLDERTRRFSRLDAAALAAVQAELQAAGGATPAAASLTAAAVLQARGLAFEAGLQLQRAGVVLP